MKNKFFWLTISCIFTVSLLNIAFLYQYKDIIDAIAVQNQRDFLNQVFVMGIIVIIMLIFEYIRQIVNVLYLNQIGFQLQATLIGKLLSKPYDVFAKQGSGHYISQVNNDLEQLKEGYYDAFFTIFQGVCSFLIASFALLNLDVITALFIILVSFLPVIIPYLFKQRRRKNQNDISYAQQFYHTRLSDVLNGWLAVKNVKQTEEIVGELDRRYKGINSKVSKANQTTVTMRLLVGFVFYITVIVILVVGGMQVFAGVLTVGGLTAILTISEQLVEPINSVAAALLDRHAVKDLKALFTPSITSSTALKTLTSAIKTITIQNLSYCVGGKTLFHHFNYVFEQGKSYLIIGKSGCGKSTLGLLLTKNISLQTGNILFNQ